MLWIFISYFLYISSTLLQLYALLIATQLVRNDMSQHRASADNVTYLILVTFLFLLLPSV